MWLRQAASKAPGGDGKVPGRRAACIPEPGEGLFVTDGGLETTLVFHENTHLPEFAAFVLLDRAGGRQWLKEYFTRYAVMARRYHAGLVLESVTWRASRDWGRKLGYSETDLADLNRRAIDMLVEIRDRHENPRTKMVISGCIGPRGDGYRPGSKMSAGEAEAYHAAQIKTFSDTDADMTTAMTVNYIEEAIGMTRAAASVQLPIVISFTLETDGRLPAGESIAEAIEAVDADTGNAPAYYMINCAHPTHFSHVFAEKAAWLDRIGGIRANASRKSHAELDAAEVLDDGDPIELGAEYRALMKKLPALRVVGGCCGTDHRHIDAICRACIV